MRRFFTGKKHRNPTTNSIDSDPSDDSHYTLLTVQSKRSWKLWIGAKRSRKQEQQQQPWPTKLDILDDDDFHDPNGPTATTTTEELPSPSKVQAIGNLDILVKNSLLPPLAIPPFVQHESGPLFPRSTNRLDRLPPRRQLRVDVLRAHLLSRTSQLSQSELSFFSSKQPTPSPQPTPLSFPDISRPSNLTKSFPSSPGLRLWVTRPCFEVRYSVYLATEDGVQYLPVTAASIAVAALEYSEHIDVMIDPDFEQQPYSTPPTISLNEPEFDSTPTLSTTVSHAPAPEQPLLVTKRNSYTAVPSPLRNDSNADEQSAPKKSSTFKRIVRFADSESDGEDGVPLHVIRMKKKREQKANFLRQERLRRAREEEEKRQQLAQEVARREIEAIEREQRRQQMERERKEKEKAMYAETIASTRLRRETARIGGIASAPSSNTSSLLVPSASSTSLNDSGRNKSADSNRRFSRVHHDVPPSLSIPRKESSDSALFNNHPTSSPSSFQYPSDSSPASSRPPSMTYSPVSVSPGSRPPSTYSTHTSSSEDVRSGSIGKRNSIAAAGSASARPMIASHPTWSGSNPNFQYIPPVPAFPDFVHDMPLLPPTAPFMKQLYKPRLSSTSRNASPGPSTSSGNSINSSNERVNHISNQSHGTSSSPRPATQRQYSGTRNSSSSNRPHHERRSSGDSGHTSRTQSTIHRPLPTTSQSVPTLSRGRPLQPQYPQAPSAWTSSSSPPLPIPQTSGSIPMFISPVAVAAPSAPSLPYNYVGLNSSGPHLLSPNIGLLGVNTGTSANKSAESGSFRKTRGWAVS